VLLIVVIPPEIVITIVENPTINEESKDQAEAEAVAVVLEEVAIIAVSLDTFLENVLTKRMEVRIEAEEDLPDRAAAAVLLVDVLTAEKMGTFLENVLTKRPAVVEIGAADRETLVQNQEEEEEVAGVSTAAKKDTFQGNVPMSEEEVEVVIDRVRVVEREKGVILVEIPVIFQETVLKLVRTEISC